MVQKYPYISYINTCYLTLLLKNWKQYFSLVGRKINIHVVGYTAIDAFCNCIEIASRLRVREKSFHQIVDSVWTHLCWIKPYKNSMSCTCAWEHIVYNLVMSHVLELFLLTVLFSTKTGDYEMSLEVGSVASVEECVFSLCKSLGSIPQDPSTMFKKSCRLTMLSFRSWHDTSHCMFTDNGRLSVLHFPP